MRRRTSAGYPGTFHRQAHGQIGLRERGGFGLDGADQVVQRAFGCDPERGGDEPRVKAVSERGQSGVAQQARGDARGVEYV
jgi:hypothetical protein